MSAVYSKLFLYSCIYVIYLWYGVYNGMLTTDKL